MNTIHLIQKFKKEGVKVLDQITEDQLSSIIREANKAYYTNNPILTDNEYDIMKEYIEIKYPSSNVIFEIGAPVDKNKVTLPYFMGSMEKIKADTKALNEWKLKYPGSYLISAKLDGVSALFVNNNGIKKLYTRGDGFIGQDISYLIPYLRLPKKKDIAIRGELIIPIEVFEKKYKKDLPKSNPRNFVAGLINRKKIDQKIKDINFVAYELINPIKKPSEQFKYLSNLDIEIVPIVNQINISNEILSDLLMNWRNNSQYQIDGIIVTDDNLYERKDKNPEHSFAFKMLLSDQIAEAKVVDVIWTPSKDGYLKPRVKIEPIYLGGVKIEYATGKNASFIEENKIGIGSLIKIIRSGDVIPDIQSVTIPSEKAKMPDVPYKWTDTHVDIILIDFETDKTVLEKNITSFFKGIGVDGLGSGNVNRLIEAGYDTVCKILKMKEEDFLNVEGFKEKMANKLYYGIKNKLFEASLTEIMAASNCFARGFSDKKLELIMNELPDILTLEEPDQLKIEKVSNIKGMAEKTSIAFVEKIPIFMKFLYECNLKSKLSYKIPEKEPNETHSLYGKIIVMSGFRDKDLINKLKIIGAIIGESINKNTFALIVKNLNDKSTKISDAKKLGIPLLLLDDFRKKYTI